MWGNFIPFKNLVLDEASYAQAQNSLISITNTNSAIENSEIKPTSLRKLSKGNRSPESNIKT